MTRTSLDRTLRHIYWALFVVILLSVAAKLADYVPGLAGSGLGDVLGKLYELMRDMSLLIATAGVAYITNVFQKRSKFVESLEEEWRGIVRTKSALYAFCEKEQPSADDYVAAFCRISETIDNMRIVYKNAGETDALVGLYPYAPLHDMRRALQSIDPRKVPDVTPETRKLVRDAILQSFYALRENFLEELDIEPPVHPLLIYGGRRLKRPGALAGAMNEQNSQRRRQDKAAPGDPRIDQLLAELYQREKTKEQAGS